MPFHLSPALIQAMIASLLLHAGLLLVAGKPILLPDNGVSAEPIKALLMTVREKATPLAAHAESKIPAKAVVPIQEKQKRPETPLSNKKTVKKQVIQNRPSVEKPAQIQEASLAGESEAITPAMESSDLQATAVGEGLLESDGYQGGAKGAGANGQGGVGDDGVSEYRTLLAMGAKRFKRYPALARNRGWEGKIEIALEFQRDDSDPVISLKTSCGKSILDEQALEMIRQAVRVTDMPEPLKGQAFRLLLPVEFSLQGEA